MIKHFDLRNYVHSSNVTVYMTLCMNDNGRFRQQTRNLLKGKHLKSKDFQLSRTITEYLEASLTTIKTSQISGQIGDHNAEKKDGLKLCKSLQGKLVDQQGYHTRLPRWQKWRSTPEVLTNNKTPI